MINKQLACLIIGGCIFFVGCTHQPYKPDNKIPLTKKELALWAYMAGQLVEKQKNYEQAVDYYKQVLDIDPDATTVRRYLVQNLIRLSKFHEAAKEYRVLVAQTPEDQKTKFILGQLHEAGGNTEMAESIYRETVKMGKTFSGPFTRLGVILLQQDKGKEAVGFLKKSLTINAKDREARRTLMRYYLSIDKWQLARQLLEKGLEHDSNNIEWLAYLAQINEENKLEEKAKSIYLKIIRIYPDYHLAYRFLSLYYLKRSNWEEAIPFLRKELDNNPEDLLIKRNLGLALYENNQLDEAGEILYNVAQINQNDALTRYLLGSIYRKRKLNYLAEYEFKAAIKLNGSLKDAYYGLASIYIAKGEYEEALALLGVASIKFKNSAYVFLQYGIVLMKVKDYSYALKMLSRSKELGPNNPEILFHLGRAYHYLDDLVMAAFYWKRCIQINDQFAEAYNYLGYSHIEKGLLLNKAVKWLERAVTLEPGNGYYLDSLGWAYYKKKNYKRALKTILCAKLALERKELPVDAVIREHLGDIYFKLKRFVEAKEEWKRAIELDKTNKRLKNKIESIPAIGGKIINDLAYP